MRTLSGPPRAPALSDFRASWGERSGLAPAQSGVGGAWSTEPYRRGGDLSGSGGRPPSPGPRGRNLRPAIWGKRGPHATRGPSGTRGPTPPPSAPVGTPRTTVRSGTGTVSQVASVLKRWGALEAISGQSGTAFPWRPPGQSCPSPALPGPGVHRGPALRREAGPEERAFLFLARRPPSRGPGADQARVTMNNPIPSNLKSEAKKAAKILREFTEITSRNGPDKIIPAHVIAKAKGLAVLSVIKAGFLVTARGGSGIVLARLPDGKWSAPSAIGIAGLGGGFEIGIEVSDLVIILNYGRAVEAFAKGGNLTLGGNLTVAVGPLGRNLEGNVALRSSAAVFTYCRSRGLFAGISLEGSCLIERKETNRKFYCQDVRAYDILFGDMPRPAQAEDLYEILDAFTEKYESEGQRINARRAARERRKALAQELPPKPLSRPQPSSPQGPLSSGSQSDRNEYKLYPELPSYPERVGNSRRPTEVTALYSFEGQQPGDLSFKAGDRITVTSKTDSNFDWWEGSLRGQTGIFPANYVTMN